MIYALNLCDYGMAADKKQIAEWIVKHNIKRIYMGSYFCDNYLLAFNKYEEIIQIAKENCIYVTLVIPIVGQTVYKNVLDWLDNMVCKNNIIDEIVCNDVGMIQTIKKKYPDKVVIRGRLLDKHCREDIDSKVSCHETDTMYEIDTDYALLLIKKYSDLINEKIHFHYPYFCITSGRICLFASISRPGGEKFRVASPCKTQCIGRKMLYKINGEKKFWRIGKAIYQRISEPLPSFLGFGRVIITPDYFEVE